MGTAGFAELGSVTTTPSLQLLAEASGRVVSREPGLRELKATFSGSAAIADTRVVDVGSLTYSGEPRLFRGDFRVVFNGPGGAPVAALTGAHVGRHVGRRLVVLQVIGILDAPSAAFDGDFAVVDIQVHDLSSYSYRLFRLRSDQVQHATDKCGGAAALLLPPGRLRRPV